MKRIILCCDGTWNSADQQDEGKPCPTNVFRLAYRVAKREAAIPQVVFYDQGVGTGNSLDRITGGAFGKGLEDNIHDAYRFLMANYEAGDELFLFGFSRGAFTARSIGGMIRKCGILKRECVQHYVRATEIYRDESHPDDDLPRSFRRDHSVSGEKDVEIAFIGVWDTVGALGIPLRGLRFLTKTKHQFHDTELSGTVRRAAHALAIDELRGAFEPTLWSDKKKDRQSVEQVWFCGAHSDVGGGYLGTGLSDIALEWMIEKANEAGLEFIDPTRLAFPCTGDACAEIHDSKEGLLYNLAFDFHRPIGLTRETKKQPARPDHTQSLHPSVLERWDQNASYRPKALFEYLRRVGDPRVKDEVQADEEAVATRDVG
jgi:uncharacterized protein (DUF2235 family)